MQDARILRDRQGAHSDASDAARAGGPEHGNAAMVAQTTYVSSYPTTAAVEFAVIPCDVDGPETEGAAATYVPRTGTLAFALNLGTQVPPVGTIVICHAVGGRWCFRYDG